MDDFQVVDDAEVLETLGTLLRHESPLHWVLISRTDPNLPLHRLRVADQLLEIRSAELAFDLAEAGVFLSMNGPRVPDTDVALLVERTEGWAAGLRLAAMFLSRDSTQGRAADFAGDDRAVADYLLSEVLDSQTDDMQTFLLRTSITDRICGELADVLLVANQGQRHLEELERSNTFITALGNHRDWYRYHPLLREALAHQLSSQQPAVFREVHRRAADWFARRGDGLPAMRHALAAKDWPLLGEVFVTVAAPMVLMPERGELGGILRQIPDSEMTRTAALQVSAVARLEHAGRYAEMAAGMTRARDLLTTDTTDYAPMTAAILGLYQVMAARTRGDVPGVLEICASTLASLDSMPVAFPAAANARAIAQVNQGLGLFWTGQPAAAHAVLRPALAIVTASGMELTLLNCLGYLGLTAVMLGKLGEAATWAEQGRQVTEERGWMSAPQAAASYLTAALVNLARGRAGEANLLLKQGSMALHEPTAAVAAHIAQILVDISLGRLEQALRSAEVARNMLERNDFPEFLTRWVALARADAALAGGDPVRGLAALPGIDRKRPIAGAGPYPDRVGVPDAR